MKFNIWAAVVAFAIVVAAVVVLIVTGHANGITIAVAGVTGFVTALVPVWTKVIAAPREDLQ